MVSHDPALTALLKSNPLFSLVEPAEMQELHPLLHPVTLEAGQVLFRERTVGDGMWILGKGPEVSISQRRGNRPMVIAYARDGETVGEMALIDDGFRSGAAVVTQGGSAYHVSALNFKALRDAYRPVAFKVLRQICRELCARLRATSARIVPASEAPGAAPHPEIPSRHATEDEVNEFPPFKNLPKVVKLALSQKLQPVEMTSAQEIFREGEEADAAFFLLQGEATIFRRERKMQELGPGAMFGLVSVIDEGRRSGTARTNGPAKLLQLSKLAFNTLFAAGNRFAFQMVDMVCRQLVARLRAVNELIVTPEAPAASSLEAAIGKGTMGAEILPLELEIELSLDETLP
jgi:CRP-like cAMP-binding protein